MPRQKTHQNPEKRTGGYCKIRKRVSSSSSSSSAVKNYRFKRAILVGKRVGSSTPVPTWKQVTMASKSPMQKLQSSEHGVKYGRESGAIGSSNANHNKVKEGFSARKLAATLWEINGLHSPHSPVCEKIDGSKVGGQRRRSSTASQKLQITEYIAGGVDSVGKSSSIEVGSHAQGENNSSIKPRLKDVNNSLIASRELVKALFRILSQDEQHQSEITLVSALRVELDRARLQVDQLMQEHRYSSTQINALLKQFAEEKAAWKSKEKERVREAVSSMARELEIERKLRRQAERLNKKLGAQLSDSRAHFLRVTKELEGEKRAKEILQQTCDELARDMGEERVEMEKLKREREKLCQEVERERKMLQLADVLREERVQMKLTEAKYEYEEKNAALERLKTELEIYFRNQGAKQKGDHGQPDFDSKIDIVRKMQPGSFRNGENEGGADEDSGESELHSIELSMDNNNKSFKWSFVCDGPYQGESRRPSVDEVFKGRRSLSEKVQWENICLQRTTSDGIEWDFTGNNGKKQRNVNGFDKGIRALCEGSASESPATSTGKSSCLREACTAILQDLASSRDGSA